MAFDLTALILICFANLSLGLLIFLRNPRAASSRAFALVALFISLWAATNYLTNLHLHNFYLTNVFNRLAYIFAYLAVAMALIFTYYFPVRKLISSTSRNVLLFIGAMTILSASTPEVAGIGSYAGDQLVFTSGHYVWLYIISLLLLSSLIVRNLVSAIHTTRGKTESADARIQARYVLWGISISIALGLILNLLIPLVATNWHSTRYGPFLTLFLVSTLSYAIVRHKLFDIRFFVVRGAVYSLTLLLLGFLYIAPAIYIMGIVIMGFPFVLWKFILGVAFATIVAVYFENIRNWFDSTTGRIFFRDDYDAAAVLSEINRTLVSTIELNSLLKLSSELIAQRIKSEFCVFALTETKIAKQRLVGMPAKGVNLSIINAIQKYTDQLDARVFITDYLDAIQPQLKTILLKNNVAVLIKLTNSVSTNTDSLGYIMLGFKKSGKGYTSKDAKALEAMADVLTIAIQNALRFEEIQNFNITLQQRIEDATRQLRRTNAKLEALDETKDDFISMASHQLRTPLTSVKGYLSMVLEEDAGPITPLQKKMLNQAYMSSQRMVFLIADLLNVSRLKTGKFVIERTPLNLANLIQEEIGQLHETAASHSLKLLFDKPKDFPELMLDETKTRQVVMNFIDNAIHYTPSGGHITVELANNPHTVELRVRDDGIGVPKSEQHHLFTKFYRAVNARRERPDGTGLGLFMAKKVIVAQGGAVVFDSAEGKGSTFGFTLPKDKPAVRG